MQNHVFLLVKAVARAYLTTRFNHMLKEFTMFITSDYVGKTLAKTEKNSSNTFYYCLNLQVP